MGTEINYDRELGAINSTIENIKTQVADNKKDYEHRIIILENRTENKFSILDQKIESKFKETNEKLDNKLNEIIGKLDEQTEDIKSIEQTEHYSKGFLKAVTVIFGILMALIGFYFKNKL